MWKHGHLFIKFLLFISLCLSIGYLYFLEKKGSTAKQTQLSIDKLTDIQATSAAFD